MEYILNPRSPKGRIGGTGFKGGNYVGGGTYGTASGSGGHLLPVWAEIIIALSVVWVCIYIIFFVHFLRQDYFLAKPTERRRFGISLLARIAWKAFKYATLIQAGIWAVRRMRTSCCCTGRSTKKVGGTFYRKLDEEKGETDVIETGVTPPAPIRYGSPKPPPHSP